MADPNFWMARRSERVYWKKVAIEEPGQSAGVNEAAMSEPEPEPEQETATVKRKLAASKKISGSSTAARTKVEKPAPARKKSTAKSTPRKRPVGTRTDTGTSTTRPRSAKKKQLVEDEFPAVSAPLALENQGIEPIDGHSQAQNISDQIPSGIDAQQDDTRSDSDLSELGTTPRCPSPASGGFENKTQVPTAIATMPKPPADPGSQTDLNSVFPAFTNDVQNPNTPETLTAPMLPPLLTPESGGTTTMSKEIDAQNSSLPSYASSETKLVVLPITPASQRKSGRSRAQPARFRGLVPTPVEAAEEQLTAAEGNEKTIAGGDSPTAQKVSRRKSSGTKGAISKPASARRKKPVSQEMLSAHDLADDVPVITTSRKRKAEPSATTLRNKPAKAQDVADGKLEGKAARKTSVQRKTPAPRKRKATPIAQKRALQLPSPPMSESEYLEVSGLHIDSDLLRLSRALTHREPLETKPEPYGKPEVWAPGRQELCETLPYYKSAHSGCYSNGNTIYAFMFDSAGVGREYMDQDVIIARMGGSMEPDPKTGVVSQKDDHSIDAKQPQSVLNNIIHKNPIVIICGDKNAGAITKMPYRYCVLGWFKPTHVWAEKTLSKKRTVTTIRYRFERLSRSEPSWYSTAPDLVATQPTTSSTPLGLTTRKCIVCTQSCPQVYLIDWMCTNSKCTAFWEMSNGQTAPCGDLDYHPAFLLHRTTWERENPPFSLNPGVPQIGHHFGDNLSLVNTRGIVCPECGRCNSRYMFTHWRCNTPGCRWKLQPNHEVVMPSNLSHTAWDMASDGPSLIKSTAAPAIRTQAKYYSNYKVLRYTIEGVEGSVFVAKANKYVVSQPGGADDMFREMQTVDVGLERRMLRKTAATESEPSGQSNDLSTELSNNALTAATEEEEEAAAAAAAAAVDEDVNEDDGDDDHDHKAEAGTRMNAFGMNFGMPYKFIASGDSRSFEDAPAAVRSARSLLNWAQRVFVNNQAGYQDFNEELVFGYMESQKIKYHDDGEMGLGPRIATLSLGGGATMLLRVKAKYFSQVSNTGVFTYEEPLPLPLLESSGYTSEFRGKGKSRKPCKDTHESRRAAWAELKQLKDSGDMAGFRQRSKEISKELELKRVPGDSVLSFHLTHGDIVIMEGEQIQKFLEHQVEPTGSLRFALTCRTVLGNHLKPDQLPKYEVADAEVYDGSGIREHGDGDAVVWD